ncbi:hypothetical protein BDP27DRAFT_1416261 [Rhodocollybia butyracea]|uniref:Uncharacterized protein n=1 Tax=Rhodocollybia butyracea TaxID=206335 RepID=A0A9P5Q2N4_9AGAR|nr:hypothetical protein BDP27DRAFT_1416261 [Rhodocollybia butyracea]
MVTIPPGEPKTSPKPQPIGDISLIILFTTCTCCILFILWRRADAFKAVISHQLKTITRREGQIRLSQDDGPPAHDFIEDDDEGSDAAEVPVSESVGPLPERHPPTPFQLAPVKSIPETEDA